MSVMLDPDINVETFESIGVAKALVSEVLYSGDNITSSHKRVIFSPCLSALYVEVPKVACSSIKEAFGRAYGVPEDTIADWVKGDLCYSDLYHDKWVNTFKFSFVRNPFDRLVSAFENKFNPPKRYPDHMPYIEAHKALLGTDEVTFESFIRLIEHFPDWISEQHWRSQYLFLRDEKGQILVDFIGRFEQLQEGMEEISRRVGVEIQLKHLHKSKHRKKDYRDYYTPKLRRIVAERYAIDLELFDYQF